MQGFTRSLKKVMPGPNPLLFLTTPISIPVGMPPLVPVSYTHLDVYKRQQWISYTVLAGVGTPRKEYLFLFDLVFRFPLQFTEFWRFHGNPALLKTESNNGRFSGYAKFYLKSFTDQ